MKTTIEINDVLFDRVKRLASRRRTTLRAVVESALRQLLDRQGSAGQEAFRLSPTQLSRSRSAGLTEDNGRIHDARIATSCGQHGVRTLWSADRDRARFSIRW